MKKLNYSVLAATLLGVSTFVGAAALPTLNVSAQTEALHGKAAPNWKLTGLDGNLVSLSDFAGKVVVLDFWATWCPPCRQEIPDFVKLQEKFRDKGLVVVGVSLDQQGAETVKSFAKEHGINYPVVLANKDTLKAYGDVQSIPTTFIINREGKIVNSHVGFTDAETFEKEIKALL